MKIVIIGNGIAGITVARTALRGDPNLKITMYADEPYSYYLRPRLIDLIAGDDAPASILQYPDTWYSERGIRHVTGTGVTALSPEEHRIVLADGSTDIYDALVLAVGAHSWMPPIPGIESPGVFGLRTMRDALAIRERARHADRAIIIGGGLLGLDLSMALRARGLEVSVIELLPRLLPRQLDEDGARILAQAMSKRGVSVLTDRACAQIRPNASGLSIDLQDGSTLDAGMIVVAVGVRPNVGLAASAGIACDRGIVVDEHLATNAPNVYAVGDAAEFAGHVWGIIPAAVTQGRVLGRYLGGDSEATYEDIVPSTTLKVVGIDLASLGEANPPDSAELRCVAMTDEREDRYCKLVLKHGHIIGAIVIGDRDRVGPISQLMRAKVDVSGYESRLISDGFDLRTFARERTKGHHA